MDKGTFLLDIDYYNQMLEIIEEAMGEEEEMNVYVSYLMSYGYDATDVYSFCKNFKVEVDQADSDPDDNFDIYGSMKVSREKVDKLKEAFKLFKESLKV